MKLLLTLYMHPWTTPNIGRHALTSPSLGWPFQTSLSLGRPPWMSLCNLGRPLQAYVGPCQTFLSLGDLFKPSYHLGMNIKCKHEKLSPSPLWGYAKSFTITPHLYNVKKIVNIFISFVKFKYCHIFYLGK